MTFNLDFLYFFSQFIVSENNQYGIEYSEQHEPLQVIYDPYQEEVYEYQYQDGFEYVESPEDWITDPPERITDLEGFQYDYPRKPEIFDESNIARVKVKGDRNNNSSRLADNPPVTSKPYTIINSEKSNYIPENYENQILLEDDLELAALEEARDSDMNPIFLNSYAPGVQQTYILQPIGEISSVINPTALSEISAPSMATQLKLQTGNMIAREENGEYKVEVPFGLYADDTSVIESMQPTNLQPLQLQQVNPIFLDEQFQQQYYNPNFVYVTGTDDLDFSGQTQYPVNVYQFTYLFTILINKFIHIRLILKKFLIL